MTPDLVALIERTRIVGILNAYLNAPKVDHVRLRWFLRRLTQTATGAGVETIVDRFSEIAPSAADAIRNLRYGLPNYTGDTASLGDKLLGVLDDPAVASSPYLRLIVLSLFASVAALNHLPRLLALFPSLDPMAQREVILAATNAKADGWLRSLKPLAHQDPWVRRAVLLSSAVWADDERNHWKRSIKGAYDFLDDLVLESLPAREASKTVRRRLARRPTRLQGG
jgi:hypothetical protein